MLILSVDKIVSEEKIFSDQIRRVWGIATDKIIFQPQPVKTWNVRCMCFLCRQTLPRTPSRGLCKSPERPDKKTQVFGLRNQTFSVTKSTNIATHFDKKVYLSPSRWSYHHLLCTCCVNLPLDRNTRPLLYRPLWRR